MIGTSTNPRAPGAARGVSAAISRSNSRDPDWPNEVKKATGDKGVNLIVDLVSGDVANQNLEAAAMLGRIVNVGRLGGMKGEFDFDLHALKRIDYIGVTFRTRTLDEVREINRLMRADLWPAIEAGKLSLPIHKTYPLADIADGAVADARQPAFRQDRNRRVMKKKKRRSRKRRRTSPLRAIPGLPRANPSGINLT